MSSDIIKDVIQRTSSGVYIIGVKTPEKTNDMTAAWVIQASFNPPTVMVAIGKTHYTSELIPKAGYFSVNILSDKQKELAVKCGFTSGRDADKLEGVPHDLSSNGVPVLKDCAAWMECKLTGTFVVADHVVFAGEVLKAADQGGNVMLYNAKDFF